jgi:S-layer homology domain
MRSSRLKLLTAFSALSLLSQTAAWSARFVDTSGTWSEKYVVRLSDKGIIPAAGDGRFNPDQPVTRAQLADWMVKVLGLENQPVPTTSSFADVSPSDWFFHSVEIIRQNNYISGYADGFRPNQFIQRAEVMTILSRTLDMQEPDLQSIASELAKYTDGSKVPGWAKTGVAKASAAGILVNDQNPQILNPTAICTRGDAAALLSRLDEYKGQQQVEVGERLPSQGAAPPNNGGAVGTNSNDAGIGMPNTQSSDGGEPGTAFGGSGSNSDNAGQLTPLADLPSEGSLSSGGNVESLNQSAGMQAASAPPNFPPIDPGAPLPQQMPLQQIPQQQIPQQQQQQQQQLQQQTLSPQFQAATGQVQGGGFVPPQQFQAPAPTILQGGVTVVAAGTKFPAKLDTTLHSGTSQVGDQVKATLGQPLFVNGIPAVPAGSILIGNVSKVVSAKRFHFGKNGSIDIKFYAIQTPDRRQYQISASVDGGKVKVNGGGNASRVGKGLLYTGIGAGGGALAGTAMGAMFANPFNVGQSLAYGALFGGAIGGGAGAVTSLVRKGQEVRFPAGLQLPVKLDSAFKIAAPPPQPYYGGSNGAPPQGGWMPPGQGSPGGGYPPSGGYPSGGFMPPH